VDNGIPEKLKEIPPKMGLKKVKNAAIFWTNHFT